MALTHATGFTVKRKIDFFISEAFNKKRKLSDALVDFEAGKSDFIFTEKERTALALSLKEISGYSFLAEEIFNRGLEIITIIDKEYPKTLKSNLKKAAPLLIYTKGNKELLNTSSVAIVGARKSGERSLLFTDNIAKKAVSEGKAVVSGFAKGVDRQALDSALKYNGKSIIVLPQGINTYTSKTYYAEINKGNVLVMSTYHPKARWATGLAMDRNKIIYGLADEIFVAESDSKGGTWAGVNDGLKKGRSIFIRNPEPAEKNANAELIKKGAVPVNMDGNLIEDYKPAEQEKQFAEEQAGDYSSRPPKNKITKEDLIDKVITELKNSNKKLAISGIKEKFNINRSDSTISKWLKSSGKLIHIKQRGKLFFDLAERKEQDLKLF